MTCRRRIRPCRFHLLRASRALDPRQLHQPRGLVPADHDPCPPGGLPELAHSIDLIVGLPELDQLRDQLLIPQRTDGWDTVLDRVVAARGHLQLSADELDSEPPAVDQVVFVRVDERDYLR